MTRNDFQKLAELRAAEAQALLISGHFDGAYYLAGYAVECALKAHIARKFKQDDIPDKKLGNDVYIHELTKLLEQAGLKEELKGLVALQRNWSIVKDWSEQSRYELNTTRNEADQFSMRSHTQPKEYCHG